MSILESIRDRRSTRSYTARPVSEQSVTELLEAARLAPSGSNTQPWRFIVVRSDAMRQKLASVCHDQQWMAQAPVHIVCVADVQAQFKIPRELMIDEHSPESEVKKVIRCTAIAIEHLVLQAQALGLSTCWVAWFMQADIRPALGVPEDKFVVAVITVGYSEDRPSPRPRRSLDEIVQYESWNGS
jgi:nitroreductase